MNEDYNLSTVAPILTFDRIPKRLDEKGFFLSTRQANAVVKPFIDSINLCDQLLAKVKEDERSLSEQSSKIRELISKDWEDGVDSQTAKLAAPSIRKGDSIERVIRIISQSAAAEDSRKDFSLDVKLAEEKVKLAYLERDISSVSFSVIDKAIKSLLSFSSNSTKKRVDSLHKMQEAIWVRNDTLTNRKLRFSHKVDQVVRSYHSSRFYTVGFGDFLYFSVITATSTGYGDILPNRTGVRAVVSGEVIVCLLLFAWFFYVLAKPDSSS